MKQIDLGDDALVLEPDGKGDLIEAVTEKIFKTHKV